MTFLEEEMQRFRNRADTEETAGDFWAVVHWKKLVASAVRRVVDETKSSWQVPRRRGDDRAMWNAGQVT